jgi:hypothetical protein
VAQNEAVFAIRISDDGTLQIVQKNAKRAAAGLDDVGAAADRAAEGQNNYNRGQKGVIGASANSTKSFSKMRDAMGGSSGLVGAYATLAANVFALSAAFNALSRASKVDQLTKSIAFLSASSGDNLNRISKNLVEVTGNAISMADAMKSASFGTSAGFDSTQLETLAKVAKGASAALGRDLNDSFDRLTRGAAKLEPEILDELGIIVRIDKATQDYANAIGKNVKELSAWERQQAFVNAINTQGIKKYGELADSIQASPFDKLAAAATNAANASLKFLVEALKLPELFDYISENALALSGIVIAFAGTITRQMLPAIYKIPEALARVADKAAIQSFEKLKTSLSGVTSGLGPGAKKAVGDFTAKLEQGKASAADLAATQGTLTKSLGNYTRLLRDAKIEVEKLTNELNDLKAAQVQDIAAIAQTEAALAKATEEQIKYKAAVSSTESAQRQVASATAIQNNALAKNKIASGVAAIGAWSFYSGWKEVITGISDSMQPLGDATDALGRLRIGATNAFTGIAGIISASFASVLTLISLIGVLTALFPGLEKMFMEKFFPEKEFEKKSKALEEVSKKTEELTNHLAKVDAAIVIDVKADKLDSTVEALQRFTGVLREISAVIASTYEDLRDAFSKVIDEAGRADARAELIKVRLQKEELQQEARSAGIPFLIGQPRALPRVGAGRAGSIEGGTAQEKKLNALETRYAALLAKEDEAAKVVNKLSNLGLDMRLEEFGNVLLERSASLQKLEDSKVFNALGVSPEAKTEASKKIIAAYKEIEKVIKIGQGEINTLLGAASKETPDSQARTDILKQADDRAIELQGQVNALTTSLRSPYEAFSAEVDSVSDKVGNAGKALNTFAKKGEGRFGALIESFEALSTSANAPELDKVLSELRSRGMAETLGTSSIQGFLTLLKEASKEEARIPGLKGALENTQELTKLFPNVVAFEQKRVDAVLELQKAEVSLQEKYIKTLEVGGASAEVISGERKTLVGLQLKGLANETATLEVSRRIAQEEEKRKQILLEISQITLENAKSEQALANYKKTGKLELTLSQQVQNIKTETALKKRSFELEKTAQMASLQFERIKFKILLDKLVLQGRLSEAQRTEAEKGLASIDAQIGAQEELYNLKEKAIGLGEATQFATIAQANAPSAGTTETSLPTGGQAFDAKGLVDRAKQAGADVGAAAIADIEAKMATAAAGSAELAALEERLKRIAAGEDPLVNFRAGLAQANTLMAPFIASMKELGPEGVLIASVAEGGLAIANSWSKAAETIKGSGTAMEKGAAIASAAGATLGAISQIMQANSSAKIAAIDSEIAAEQKRDGKSKESLARIASLEKKKESEKKKAFETNKKMQMAQTVINTAAAVMQAAPNIPLMILMGVMGAAQLALIASQSYQGGGASTSAGAPSSIAVGQRTSSVDLAKSKSASGEIAYMRGEQGMGGPGAFTPTPAFTGMKYRASGGATTGFMVGEQGPELFIPERPGTIVPADQTANMGGVTNVSFSISAIDTQGVEDMLENQKGAIINMIRSAANSYGQPFMEQVDTSVYRPAPKSRTYRR